MATQKLPLFDGMIGSVGGSPVDIFSPPDKNLTDGTQAHYELHLWAVFAAPDDESNDVTLVIGAQEGSDPPVGVWTGKRADIAPTVSSIPIKVLDGYPVRGDVTLTAEQTGPAADNDKAMLFGYYYRVGQGAVVERERRAIGAAGLEDFNEGVPVTLDNVTKVVIHKFEPNRIDEITLAVVTQDNFGGFFLNFEDAANNILKQLYISISASIKNSDRDPQSVYSIYQCPFGGGGTPNLDHLSVVLAGTSAGFAHGYFTRH